MCRTAAQVRGGVISLVQYVAWGRLTVTVLVLLPHTPAAEASLVRAVYHPPVAVVKKLKV